MKNRHFTSTDKDSSGDLPLILSDSLCVPCGVMDFCYPQQQNDLRLELIKN